MTTERACLCTFEDVRLASGRGPSFEMICERVQVYSSRLEFRIAVLFRVRQPVGLGSETCGSGKFRS